MYTQRTGYTDEHAAAGLDAEFPSIDTWANQFPAYEILVDDPAGAKHEAGDLIQANVDWDRVGSLAGVIERSWIGSPDQPILFKSVGCAAWDLAAARLARHCLSGA